MKSALRLLSLLLAGAAFGPPGQALAQTIPSIEFAPGAGNPTTNGSSSTDQVITFQNNVNNPNDNTFTTLTPAITTRFSLSGQVYNNVNGTANGFGETFGTTAAANGTSYIGTGLFQALNTISNGTNANVNSIYTAASTNTAGTGIDVAANRSVWLFTATRALAANASTASTNRNPYATLTVSFSQPVSNPVLHITGLGGTVGGLGFSSELDLINTPNVTLSKLSGSTELNVNATQILNGATTLGAATGSGAASGSVLVTTTQPISSLQFRIYLRGDGTSAPWYTTNGSNTDYPGDVWLMGVSLAAPSDVATTLANVTGASVQAGAPITYTATSQNNGPSASNVSPQVQLPAGLLASSFTTLPSGASYNPNSGILTLPTRNVAANSSTTYSFTFTAPNYTTTINGVASSTADVTDPTAGNNDGSAANAQVNTTVTLPNNGCPGTAYAGAAGSGLYAEYYKGYFADNLGYFSANTAGITRTDGTLNFATTDSWGNLLLPAGNPVATGTVDNPNTYSARYRGAVSIPATGTYTFYLTSDDASYMWIDGAALAATPTLASALIQNGNEHGSVTVQKDIVLTAGQHNILIFYGENAGQNNLTFEYSGGPGNLARQIVPNSALCPTQAPSADLATTISGPQTAVVGQTVYYLATTTNLGTDATTNVVPTITLANKPAASTVTVTNGTYDASTGIVTFNAVNLAANASVVNTVGFVAQASPATATGKAASSSLNSYDPVANNNDGSAANANVTTTVSPTGAQGTPANCATAGKDGAAGSLATNPNAYYPSTAAQTLTGGTSTTIAVGAARGANTSIATGDLLLVIQMQGADLNTTDDASYGDGVAGGSANGTSVTTNFTAGTYEYVTVASVSNGFSATAGGTITLTSALKNSYSNAVATTTTGQRTFQVIRVPQYTNVTLGASILPTAWNGSTGGIVALDVDGQLNLNGFSIDASGLGFRGGAGRVLGGAGTGTTQSGSTYRSSASVNTNGTKGEGIAGTPRYVNDPAYAATNNTLLDTRTATTGYPTLLPGTLNDGYPSGDNGRGAPGNAGGGGTDSDPVGNAQNSGGGGGANGGRGGRGGNAWQSGTATGGEPGAAFPAASSSRLVLGGGGGSGSTNNGTGTPGAGFASSGAAGGGAVLVRTGTLTGTGSILANGANANNTVDNDGSGGGGSGGSILVTVTNSQATTASLTLTAGGGTGGNNGGAGVSHGPGGGGGGGVIFTSSTVVATATANGASNGTTAPGNTAYGAEAGTIGVGNAAISNSIANSTAGANCIADLATTITGPASAPAGTTVALKATFSNIGAQTASAVTRTVTFPANTLLVAPTATTGGGVVSGTTLSGYTITYPATSLASAASNTYDISYTAPATGPVTATSTISNNPSSVEGGLLANNTFSVTTAIGLVADVTTALTGPQTVSPGQPTGTYTATFTNEGPSTASNVTRTVTLPAGASNIFVNGSPYTPTTANTIDFGTATTLNSGASNAFTFRFTPATTATATTGTPTVAGTVDIVSNVGTATSQNTNPAPDASTIRAAVVAVADVATTITASPATLAAGTLASSGSSRFNVVFSNNGPSTAAGVVASVQLPAGLTNVSATNNPNGVYNSATGVLTFPDVTSLNSSASVSSTITFDVPATNPATVSTAAGTIVASSRISTTTGEAGQTANNTAPATLNVTPAFDLTTTLMGPASAVAGSPVTLAVTTTNNGPSATTNVVQTVQLVSGLSNVYVSNGGVYNPATTTQTLTVNGVAYSVPAGGVVFPAIVGMPSGQTVANSITYSQPSSAFAPSALVTPNTAGNATTAGDTNTANNTAYLNGNTSATNLTILNAQSGSANAYTTITTSATSTTLGSPVTLTVTTGNNGPNAATGVTQLVQLVPGFTTSSLQINGITGTANANNTVITFGTNGPTYSTVTGLVTFPTLTDGTSSAVSNGSTSGTSVTNTITLTPTAAAVATTGRNGRLLPTATVRTTNTDPVPADNVASVGITLVQSTDLATTITGPATAAPGQSVTYTASFVNNGPMLANGVTETVQLPAGLGTVTVTDAAGNTVSGATYNATTGQVSLPNQTALASGATQAFRLTFAAPAQSFAPNSSIGSTTADAVGANNSASVATAVTATADLATTVAGPPTAVVGNAVTYSVNTTNNGPVTATNATTTLQLPAGFDATTLRVNGTTGTLNTTTGVITYTFGTGATATTATYSTSSGLVTFPAVASLANGASASNYVTFVMPNVASGQLAGVASATSNQTDAVPTNNTSSVATSIAPTTVDVADLTADVKIGGSATATTTVGTGVAFTATYGNNGPNAATSVVPTLQLLPGLTTTTLTLTGATGTASSSGISFSNGASYNQTTGLLTFATIASQASGTAGTVSYVATVTAPANGPLVATAATTSATTEPNTAAAQANNVASATATVTPNFDEVTTLTGPAAAAAGSTATYTATAINNGPSLTTNTTTQTVTLPAGVAPITGSISGNGVYSSSTNTITWTIPAGQGTGSAGAIANTFSLTQPTNGATVTASVSVTGDSNPNNNAAFLNGATSATATTVINQAPVAFAIVNSLQNPQSNDAGGLTNGLLISPLNASDFENAFATNKYTITSIPTNSGVAGNNGTLNNQGVLYYNDGTTTGAYSPVTVGQTLTDAQAKTLRFKAATGFVGNASFTYTTTDAAGNTSLAANYTIPVETDTEANSYTLTPAKGGSQGAYVAGDVIAFTTDVNGAVNNAATASVYQANGKPQTGSVSSGIVSATAGAFTSSNPAVTSLSSLGLAVQPDGRLVVTNPGTTANPTLRPGTYTVSIATVDVNGGVTTQTVSFTIPSNPLPVVLTAFTATAVQNRDAQLAWTTASEANSAFFDVERSFDGQSFAKIGQVAAKGNSLVPTSYTLTDAGVAPRAQGPVYYRLKQVDLDGTTAYSPVRTVSFSKAASLALSLYPNPAQFATGLDLSQLPTSGTYQVSLLDATGRLVRTATLAGGQVQPLDLHDLASGSYHVLVTGSQSDGSALRQTLRLTKE